MSFNQAQQLLFGLITAAQEQQQAVLAALEGLKDEQLKLAEERLQLAEERIALKAISLQIEEQVDTVRQAGDRALFMVRQATVESVREGVGQSLADVATPVLEALNKAVLPLVDRTSQLVDATESARVQLVRAGRWFAWKWVAVAGGGLAGLFLVTYLATAWQISRAENARAEEAESRANVADLEKRGGRVKLEMCEAKPRPRQCVRIDRSAGVFGKDGEERAVLWGY